MGAPVHGRPSIRPEWLFVVANRLQALAAAPAGPSLSPTLKKGDDTFGPQSELERQLTERLVARLAIEQSNWAVRRSHYASVPLDDGDSEPSARDVAVTRARALLETDLSRHWTLGGLAGRVGCNRTDLEIGFRRECSYTVHTYLTIRRVNAAQELLRTTAWRIQEVAKAVGFRSKVSLYEHFRRVLRMTPDQYRRRWIPVPARDRVRALLSRPGSAPDGTGADPASPARRLSRS